MPKTFDPLHTADSNLMHQVTAANLDDVADPALRVRAAEHLKLGKIVWTNARGFLRIDEPPREVAPRGGHV